MDVTVTGVTKQGKIFISTISQHSELELVGVCDSDSARLTRFTTSNTYTHHEEMVEAESPDLVVITTPPGSRTEQVKQAAEAGSDIFIEEPTALSLAEFDTLVEIKEQFDATISAVHNVRFFPCMQEGARVVEQGDIGDVVSVDVDWSQEFNTPESSDPWHAELDIGKLAQGIPHVVYPSLEFVGDILNTSVEVQNIELYSETPTGFAVSGVDLDGRLCRGQYVSTCPETSRIIRVHGSEGRLIINLGDQEVRVVTPNKEVITSTSNHPSIPPQLQQTWARGHYVLLDAWCASVDKGINTAPVPLLNDRIAAQVIEKVRDTWSEKYA